jgi:ABC-type branched-subunit amino acid transport system ATPase component
MNDDLLVVNGLIKKFDGVEALTDFSCTVQPGKILGLIGPNGAGKTTLFNIISGFMTPDEGKVIFKGKDVTANPPDLVASLGLRRTFQNLRLIRQISVLENVLLSFRNNPGENLGSIFFRWKRSCEQEAINRKEAIDLLKKTGLYFKVDEPAENLSYGQQKLLSIVCCLAAKADIFLLDEPVAGISPKMIEKILSIILTFPEQGKSVIVIEHNIEFINQICDLVIFMDAGKKISEGTPYQVHSDPKVIKSYIG